MRPRIGWYVHHHGRGHLTRLSAIAPHLDADLECFSTLAEPPGLPAGWTWTVLPRDDEQERGMRPPDTSDPTARGLLHWAPIGHRGHRDRLGRIAATLVDRPVDAFVVDVSVEVTLFVRLLGVPAVVMTQPGARDDEPHRLAFAAATTIVAPWPSDLLAPAHLDPHRAKTVYTGGISRFEGRERMRPPERGDGRVVLLTGAGGSGISDADVAEASAVTGRPWQTLGGTTWADDPWSAITAASVVVAWAGQNSVADLAAAHARAVVIPQDRPFGEQAMTARALRRHRLAVVPDTWPATSEWPDIVHAAEGVTSSWHRWRTDGAARRAADAIMATARGAR
jgi:hypothetical protein